MAMLNNQRVLCTCWSCWIGCSHCCCQLDENGSRQNCCGTTIGAPQCTPSGQMLDNLGYHVKDSCLAAQVLHFHVFEGRGGFSPVPNSIPPVGYSSQNMETMIRKTKFKHQMHLPKHRVSQHLMAYHHKNYHFGLHMIAYKPCSKQPHISCSLVAYYWFLSGWLWSHIPSGKRLHGYGESPFWIGKSTVSMAMFKFANC